MLSIEWDNDIASEKKKLFYLDFVVVCCCYYFLFVILLLLSSNIRFQRKRKSEKEVRHQLSCKSIDSNRLHLLIQIGTFNIFTIKSLVTDMIWSFLFCFFFSFTVFVYLQWSFSCVCVCVFRIGSVHLLIEELKGLFLKGFCFLIFSFILDIIFNAWVNPMAK